MLKRATARSILCVLALGLTWNLPLAAQKLHNEARDKLAQQIKSDFEQLTSPDGNIFEQAIKNAEATNDADIQQWRDRERTLIDSVATILPFMTWEELQELAFTSRNQILDVSRDVDAKTNVSLDDVTAQLKQIQKEEEGIQKELKTFEDAEKNPLPTVKDTIDAVKKTLEDGSQLKLDQKNLDKISALPKDFANLKKIFSSLQAPQGLNKLILQTKLLLLQDEEARLQLRQTHFTERAAKLAEFQDHVAKYAGGSQKHQEKLNLLQAIQSLENKLKTPLDGAAKKLAEDSLQEDKTRLDGILAFEKNVNDELDLERNPETLNAIKDCDGLKRACADDKRKAVLIDALGSFWQVVGEICKKRSHPPGGNIVDSLKALAQSAPATATEPDEFCPELSPKSKEKDPSSAKSPERRLVTVLTKLNGSINLLAVRYDLLVEQTNLSQDELIFHIRMMRLNAQDQEVLLHSGITGLAIYEAGGIKPQDVANVISMAQGLAQAAIAARVK